MVQSPRGELEPLNASLENLQVQGSDRIEDLQNEQLWLQYNALKDHLSTIVEDDPLYTLRHDQVLEDVGEERSLPERIQALQSAVDVLGFVDGQCLLPRIDIHLALGVISLDLGNIPIALDNRLCTVFCDSLKELQDLEELHLPELHRERTEHSDCLDAFEPFKACRLPKLSVVSLAFCFDSVAMPAMLLFLNINVDIRRLSWHKSNTFLSELPAKMRIPDDMLAPDNMLIPNLPNLQVLDTREWGDFSLSFLRTKAEKGLKIRLKALYGFPLLEDWNNNLGVLDPEILSRIGITKIRCASLLESFASRFSDEFPNVNEVELPKDGITFWADGMPRKLRPMLLNYVVPLFKNTTDFQNVRLVCGDKVLDCYFGMPQSPQSGEDCRYENQEIQEAFREAHDLYPRLRKINGLDVARVVQVSQLASR